MSAVRNVVRLSGGTDGCERPEGNSGAAAGRLGESSSNPMEYSAVSPWRKNKAQKTKHRSAGQVFKAPVGGKHWARGWRGAHV